MFRRVFRRQTLVNSVLFCADRIGWLGSTERSGAIPSAAYYCLSHCMGVVVCILYESRG